MSTIYPLRASGAGTWVKCHAYPRMHNARPDIGDTSVREDGTAFHWACLMVWLGHEVKSGILAPNGREITDEMVDAIQPYLMKIKLWPGEPKLEFSVPAARIHPECGGTTDAFSFDRAARRLYVGDAKFGFRYVDPFECWQLLVYVCALIDYLGISDMPDLVIEMWIYQPRAYRKDGPWQKWVIRASDLMPYVLKLRAAAHATMSDNPHARVGPYCGDCNGRYDCETLAMAVGESLEMASEMVQQDLPPMALETELQRVEWALDVLDARRTGLQARAEHFIRAGKMLRFYSMEGSAGKLVWCEGVEAEVKALGELLGAKLIKDAPLITPTQAKALIDAEIVGAYSTRKPGAMKLKRVSESQIAKLFNSTI